MTGLLRWVLFALVLAALIHLAAVYFLPSLIVGQAHSRITAAAGTNTITHGPRVDETARQVVRASPDLLYSICAFDLSDGPVRFTAPIPQNTYTSLSFYTMDSTNFYAENDRTAAEGRFDVTLVKEASQMSTDGQSRMIVAPGPKGIALFRTLIADESAFDRLNTTRRQAACIPAG